ncbi:MAG: enoyl-CoA hydratase-related protein [Thermomicrobiales bacterium]
MAIDLERIEAGIAVITVSRPESLNALNSDELRLLISRFGEVKADSSIRAVILTGAGDRAFVAGADIKAMATMSSEEGREFGTLGHAAANAIEGLPQPVIAAVNGFALGGGCELALACDIRIASENAVFAQPEVSLGIPPGWGATQRLPRLVSPGVAAELILTGRRVKADEALRIGFVNAVVPAEQLLTKAKEIARSIASNSPKAVRAAKQLMRLAFNGNTPRGLEAELEAFGLAFGTDDQREGMAAFVEKRPASFS